MKNELSNTPLKKENKLKKDNAYLGREGKTFDSEISELWEKFYKENSDKSDIDFKYFLSLKADDEIEDFCDVVETLSDNSAFNIDIIYYYEAMKYLSKNDPSLNESMELAREFDYHIMDINSELLASLHASHHAESKFAEDLEEEFIELFENIEKIKEKYNV